jgi:hypothetical protein
MKSILKLFALLVLTVGFSAVASAQCGAGGHLVFNPLGDNARGEFQCTGNSGAGTGTVTSIGLAVPSWESVSGTPVTSAGTITIAGATGQTADEVVGTCNGSTTVTLCALAIADLPSGYAYSSLSGKPALGTAATQNTGTSGANLPFLNGTNTWSGPQTFSSTITVGSVTSTGATGTGNVVFSASPTFTGTLVVNTIGTGTWTATAIGAAYGGTGGSSAASNGIAHVTSGTWSYSAVNLANGDVTGTLPIGSGGCNATTASGCFSNLAPTPTRVGDVLYWNGSNWTALAGNNSGTNFLQETSGGVPSWSSGTSAVAWSSLLNPGSNLTLSMGINTSAFQYTAATSQVFSWTNTTAATSGTSQSSPTIAVCGQAWHAAASATDCLTLQDAPGNGTDAAIMFTIGHSGSSTGTVTTALPGPVTATSFNNVALTSPASLATLTLGSGKTATISNTLTFTGTDGSSVAFGTGGTVAYTANNLSVFASTTSAQLFGVLSNPTGTSLAVFNTNPTLVAPLINTITDANGNPFIASSHTASAVDSITITNAAAANPAVVSIGATGSDTNITLELLGKGSGKVDLGSTSAYITSAGALTVASCTGCGSATTINIDVGGSLVGTEGTLNFISGTYITQSCADNPGAARVDCTPDVNTAVIPTFAAVHNDINYCASTNGTTAMTCTLAGNGPALLAYAAGQAFEMLTDTSNPVSVNIDSAGVKSIKLADGSTSPPAGLILAGYPFSVRYDGTVFRLESSSELFLAITVASGKAVTFNNSITFTGTDSTTMTLPSTSQTIPGMNQINTGGSSMTWDLHAVATTAGFKVPVGAGAVPTADGAMANNSTNHTLVWGSNGTTMVGAIAATGAGTATICTNQVVTAVSSLAVPTCTTITSAYIDTSIANTAGDINTSSNVISTHISGGTNNLIAKFNSTGNMINSGLTDNGTTISTSENVSLSGTLSATTVCIASSCPSVTAGMGGAIAYGEGTPPSGGFPTSSVDGCYADSTLHGLKCSYNNLTAGPLPYITGTITAKGLAFNDVTNTNLLDSSADFTITSHTLAGGASAVLDLTAATGSNVKFPNSIAVGGFTFTLAGNLVTTGAFNTTFAQGASTTQTLPSVSTTLAGLGIAETWTAAQTFTNSDILLLGSSTGYTTFTSGNSSATNYTATVPANTGTLAELNLAQTWTAAQALGSSTATTQSACDNSTKIATTAYLSVTCATVETSTTYSPSAQSELIFNNSGSTLAITLPTPSLGLVKCLQEYHTATGAMSFIPPAGVTIYYKGIAGTAGSATGLVSGGVAGDQLCVEGTSTTTYEAVGPGATSTAWTNH